MRGIDRVRPVLRHWPVLAIGAGLGLLLGHVLDANAQAIVDHDRDFARVGLSPNASSEADRQRELEVQRRLEAIRTGEALLADQLRTIEDRLQELRELQSNLAAGCSREDQTVDAETTDGEAHAAAERFEREEQAREARLAELSQTVTSMNRNAAAELLTALDSELATELLRRLSPRDAGRILDRIPVEVAAELSENLVVRGGDR